MTIKNSIKWLDNNKKHIQAHGGSILFYDGKYYWYGENKTGIFGINSKNVRCSNWHAGIKLYSSFDLCNWKDEGLIMKTSNDVLNPFYPKHVMDRPHILYNKKNKQFVMFVKTYPLRQAPHGNLTICVGSSLKNMSYLKTIDLGKFNFGDFDVFEYKNKAYIIYDNPHTSMVIQELKDDYLDVTNNYSEHLFLKCPPYIREAPCVFIRNDHIFILTSGTTGYFPNRTICYDITNIHGKWKRVNYPCINDKNNDSFHGQFSSVFKIPNEDKYIALADNWLIDYKSGVVDIESIFLYICSNGKKGTPYKVEDLSKLSKENTSKASYMWLPIEFKDNVPIIKYKKHWSF